MIKLAVVVLIQQFAATEQYEILRRRTKNHKICLKMLYLFNNIQGKSRSDLIKRHLNSFRMCKLTEMFI